MTTTHTLYRFFDAAGALLYVGRTINPGRRWREHEKGAAWYDAVASVTREVHPTAEAVDRAERTAIATEGPLYNVALNGAVRRAPAPIAPPEAPATLAARWDLIGLDPVTDCLGDETACECPACHHRRLCGFEEMRSKYDWHPDLSSEIEAVERKYYAGHDLTDWYYDFFDIEMFARMRLVAESKARPIPAYVEIREQVAVVDCPFCFRDHKYFLTPGMPLDRPLEATCDRPHQGGQYVLIDDWLDLQDELIKWGSRSAMEAAA